MSGYKLLLVPVARVEQFTLHDRIVANVTDKDEALTRFGPFEVIADVGADKQIRMTRPVYEQVEVVD